MHETRTALEFLRERVDALLARPEGRDQAEALLEGLLRGEAPEAEDREFAHRRLAELRIETHPWRAALHLKALRGLVGDEDDSVHGMLGLCHALLGNFQAAAAAYRRALEISWRNPWYHHNLGHLLDVALAMPKVALPHLRIAHGIEPEELEIRASLIHCLARLGELTEARTLARKTFGARPENPDHAALLAWIDGGAQGEGAFPMAQKATTGLRDGDRAGSSEASARVAEVLRARMREAGYGEPDILRAAELADSFCRARTGRRGAKPEVIAAAVEYAFLLASGARAVSQASVARRYQVAPTSLAQRLGEVRDALDLVPGDQRYQN